MAKIINIGSSSSGNCFVVEEGNSTIVFDLGFKYEEFQKRYKKQTGRYISALGIDACFVTHRHLDHSRGIEGFLENGADVFAPESMCEKWGMSAAVPGHSYNDGLINFACFEAKHKDLTKNMKGAENIGFYDKFVKIDCLGYCVGFRETGNVWMYLTDTSLIVPDMRGLHYLIIECNHDLELIEDDSELHIARAVESHLSVQNVCEILKSSDTSKLREIYLIHNSGTFLDKKKAMKMIKEFFTGSIYFCKKEGGFDEI